MAPSLALDIYYHIAKRIEKPSAWLNLCLANKALHQALYPQLIRKDLSKSTGKKSLWDALGNDNLAQLERIYAVTYPDFGTSILTAPHEFNFWLKYVAGAGVYGGLNCLRFLLARAAEEDVGFVPSVDILSAAVEGHNREAVELLLQYGAPLTPQQNYGNESGPLFRVRSAEMAQYLLARGANPSEKFEGMNLLHWHCSQVWTSPLLIETLIEAGVPVDELDEEGRFDSRFGVKQRRTPLGLACANMNLPAMRTLLRHGANPFGASAEQKAERRWDAWPNQDYKFPYPIESLMVQTFKAFDEAGWGRCIWDHHISLLHEEHDDMEHEVEVRDSVLPMPSLLAKSRVPRAQVFFSKQRCYECGQGYFLADIDSNITNEAEKKRQANLLRFNSWASQMRRFMHRYFRGTQILLEAGGPELLQSTDRGFVDMWAVTFAAELLWAEFYFNSPDDGIVRDHVGEPSVNPLVEGICRWDLVTTTCVKLLDYLSNIDPVPLPFPERGLQRLRRILEAISNTEGLATYGSPIIVKLDPNAPFIGPSCRDAFGGWAARHLTACELDLSPTVGEQITW